MKETIGSRLTNWMISNDLNTSIIHQDTGISKANVSKWTKDQAIPSGKALIKLHEMYKCPISYILTGDDIDVEGRLILDKFELLTDVNKKKLVIELTRLYKLQAIDE